MAVGGILVMYRITGLLIKASNLEGPGVTTHGDVRYSLLHTHLEMFKQRCLVVAVEEVGAVMVSSPLQIN